MWHFRGYVIFEWSQSTFKMEYVKRTAFFAQSTGQQVGIVIVMRRSDLFQVVFIGMGIGSTFWGYFSDKFGRKKVCF